MVEYSRPGDDKLVAIFKLHPVKNPSKTKEAGRDIYDDEEICEIRPPGSRNVYAFPATSMSHKTTEGPFDTEEIIVSYAERFSRQYRQFKEQQVQTKSGTPVSEIPFLTPGKRAELRALNIYTLEQLAELEGIELKNLGQGGRDLKNRAVEFMNERKQAAPTMQAMEELAQMKARNEILEEDLKRAKEAAAKLAEQQALQNSYKVTEPQFDGMNEQELREYITSYTGTPPKGDVPKKTLIRMAREVAPRVREDS